MFETEHSSVDIWPPELGCAQRLLVAVESGDMASISSVQLTTQVFGRRNASKSNNRRAFGCLEREGPAVVERANVGRFKIWDVTMREKYCLTVPVQIRFSFVFSRMSASAGQTNPERWVDEYGDPLFRYALVRVRQREIGEDLVQETLLSALRSRETFAGQSSERSWLFGILKHKISDYFRKLSSETSFTDLESLSAEFSEKFVSEGYWVYGEGPKEWKPEPDEVMYRADFWQIMRACLDELPERIANVFMLREMEEVESKEICALLSISENNLWVMLHRARMALRECLAANWFESAEVPH
jgi:RNA polymerase sigma-70 factor (ECF subfamily)